MKKFLALISIVTLTACGGGGGAGDATRGSTPDTFGTLAVEGRGMLDRTLTLSPTPISSMPTSGVVNYSGVAAYSDFHVAPDAIVDDPTSVSRVAIRSDFVGGTVSGRAYNFRAASRGYGIDGELLIQDGRIMDNRFDATIRGTLREDGVNVTYDGDLVGDFAGSNAQTMLGYGVAVASVPGLPNFVARGVFVAER